VEASFARFDKKCESACRLSLRKIKYSLAFVLTSKTVHESVSSILESLRSSDLEGAKRKIDALSPEIRSERERGSLLAAAGICVSMTKGKDGTLQSWGQDRVVRAAKTVESSQLADDLDRGYAEALMDYAKLMQKTA